MPWSQVSLEWNMVDDDDKVLELADALGQPTSQLRVRREGSDRIVSVVFWGALAVGYYFKAR